MAVRRPLTSQSAGSPITLDIPRSHEFIRDYFRTASASEPQMVDWTAQLRFFYEHLAWPNRVRAGTRSGAFLVSCTEASTPTRIRNWRCISVNKGTGRRWNWAFIRVLDLARARVQGDSVGGGISTCYIRCNIVCVPELATRLSKCPPNARSRESMVECCHLPFWPGLPAAGFLPR